MIRLKKEKDIEGIRNSGAILARVLFDLSKDVQAGTPLTHFDDKARKLIREAGAEPAFLGYQPNDADKPYPAAICTSINEVVVHGLPTRRELKEGDVITLDLGVIYMGYVTDSAITIGVGAISKQAQELLTTTNRALKVGIEACRNGGHLSDIGATISAVVDKSGFSVVKGLTGHGVGFELHEDPTVYNFGTRGEGIELKPGLVLAIEPMVAIGEADTRQQPDGSFVTKDGSITAHFEHTVAITECGVEILTKI